LQGKVQCKEEFDDNKEFNDGKEFHDKENSYREEHLKSSRKGNDKEAAARCLHS
jgi:hypothetical protein